MHHEFDLCCNHQCEMRDRCQRYVLYKQGERENYVIRGCIGYLLFNNYEK